MHKETMEMTIQFFMSKATLIFENNKTIFTEIIEAK